MSDGYYLSERAAEGVRGKLNEGRSSSMGDRPHGPAKSPAWVSVTGPAGGDGRYPGQADSYYTADAKWVTKSDTPCRIQPVGGTFQTGREYPAVRVADDATGPVFVALADAGQVGAAYFGGLVNTTKQVFRGPKTFRDVLTVQTPNLGPAITLTPFDTVGEVKIGVSANTFAQAFGRADWVFYQATVGGAAAAVAAVQGSARAYPYLQVGGGLFVPDDPFLPGTCYRGGDFTLDNSATPGDPVTHRFGGFDAFAVWRPAQGGGAERRRGIDADGIDAARSTFRGGLLVGGGLGIGNLGGGFGGLG